MKLAEGVWKCILAHSQCVFFGTVFHYHCGDGELSLGF